MTTPRWITTGRGLLDFLAFVPITLPGIVLGISLIWVYFTIPIVIGYQIMDWTTRKSIQNLGASGELMKKSAADKGNKLDAYSTGTSGQNLALQSLLNSHRPTEDSNRE